VILERVWQSWTGNLFKIAMKLQTGFSSPMMSNHECLGRAKHPSTKPGTRVTVVVVVLVVGS